MKIYFLFLALLSINLCFAQIEYREINDYNELQAIQNKLTDFSIEISCDSTRMLTTVKEDGIDFSSQCMEESEGGMLIFQDGAKEIFAPDSKAFIKKVLLNEFKGKVELQMMRININTEYALFYIECYSEPNSLPRPRAFLHQRTVQESE